MHYTPRQRSQPVQIFSVVSLVLFLVLLLIGQQTAATVLALISFGVYVYGRLA